MRALQIACAGSAMDGQYAANLARDLQDELQRLRNGSASGRKSVGGTPLSQEEFDALAGSRE